MRQARDLNKQLRDLWTVTDLCRALSVTPMTVNAWRKTKSLPTVVFPGNLRDAVRFIPEEIEAWANDNGVRFRRTVRRLILQAA